MIVKKNIKYWMIGVVGMLFVNVSLAQEVLTKVNGGASWKQIFSSESIELSLATGAYNYITDNQDYTFIDRNNGTSKSILLHDGTPGQDIPPHGMIINIVNRSNSILPFNGGGANGYESINGTFLWGVNADIAANSSLVLQWNSGTSRWYEIL